MAITKHLATVFWLLSGMASRFTSSFIREPAAVFPTHHLVTITLADQAAPDKGAKDALAHLRLHFGDGCCIQPGRRMKIHAHFFVGSVGCVISVANASGLEYPIDDAAVKVDVFV